MHDSSLLIPALDFLWTIVLFASQIWKLFDFLDFYLTSFLLVNLKYLIALEI